MKQKTPVMGLFILLFMFVLFVFGCTRNTASSLAEGNQMNSQSPLEVAQTEPKSLSANPANSLSQEVSLQTRKEAVETLSSIGFTVFPSPQELPPFTVQDLQGKPFSLEQFKGSFVLLNFWATWCPPCRQEMPSMETLYTQLKNKGLVIVAISVGEDPKTVSQFLVTNPHSFPIALDPSGRAGAIFAGRGIPTTYILDPQGRALGGTIGGRDWMDPRTVQVLTELVTSKE
ncbi:MAG TPA: TlpA disulfide reductase family protein [Termitinemataceae bacterium]|nr:TlpA disulfide reductase family protein [Termitinemataceae bacterium]HOM22568.1 TlpA disulfide reductase family protein [Termitinemataceae bacterium]HPQ00076.1 TlpA disulfide reductase family protein [Termitinemataceae bacterium]